MAALPVYAAGLIEFPPRAGTLTTAALPYCDVFLTEAFAGTILKNPPLAFGKVFGTEIVWTEDDALRLLRLL